MTTNKTHIGRRGAAIVWTVAGVALVVIAVLVWSTIRTDNFGTGTVAFLAGVAFAVSLIAFVVSGAVIVSRQPRNIVGWLLMIPGLVIPASELIFNWLVALDPPPTQASLPIWVAVWFANMSWVFLIFPIFHLLLTFPTGRVLSPRWRLVVGLEVVMATFLMLALAFSDPLPVITDDEVEVWSLANPIGFIPESFFEGAFEIFWTLGLVFLTIAGAAAFARRFRAGSGIERQQLKWPLYAIAFFGLVYAWTALGVVIGSGSVWDPVFGSALAVIPISVAIAVLRYRLYDLDRIVSRTVTYLVVAALLFGTYGLVVLGLGSFMGRNNPVAVAAATLAAAALFNPIRTRIRHWVDRRFNRPRYDTQKVVDDFTATLRDRVDPDDVIDGWVRVVSETMHPEAVSAWIRR